MIETANLEQILLETVRSLPQAQQEEVLGFARSLSTNSPSTLQPTPSTPLPTLALSLQQIAKLAIADRHQLLAPYVQAMAEDFQTNPELTEFSVLDAEDWEY
ncbi:MAG: hypothetical protein VKJ46_09075 [Leptolyngbyaceae bacterium]|nr:hypothetical protein [Leptolyngbyaceae bacterium]